MFAAMAMTTEDARADEVDRCVAASERGQKERRAGHLNDAKAAFLECAADKCPSVVKKTCREWSDQVTAAIPSVIVTVTDFDKRDLADAKAEIDGKPATLGRSFELDPGPHTITVKADGYDNASQSIVARENEHGREVQIVLARHVDAPPPSQPTPPPTTEHGGGVRTITWVTGGLTVVALGSFAVFGFSGRGLASDLRDSCAPACTQSQKDQVETRYRIADISLIAAVILGGVTVYTLLSNRD
jgi:hypothetical protein